MKLPELNVRSVSKRFGHVHALTDVSLEFRAGEIHSVLGENGAGKSTLMSVLSGFVRPDSGEAVLDGRSVPLGRPYEAKRLGIEMIHQHFTLAPQFTVAENLALSRLGTTASVLDLAKLSEPGLALARELGWEFEADRRADSLTVGAQQRLEIVKAIAGDAHTLIFDEPTAVLSAAEVEDLFRVLRKLRSAGKLVILIAHKLSEVLAIADRVSVLRKGRVVASAAVEQVNAQMLAEWMVGEMPVFAPKAIDPGAQGPGLTTRGLFVNGSRGEPAVRGVDLKIDRGEIMGVGGVDGNGQLELAEAVAGVRPAQEGDLVFAGETLRASGLAIGYIPQDRQADGLAMGMSVEDNMLIAGHRRAGLTHGIWIRPRAVYAWAAGLIERFQIKTESPNDPISSLSGGNQQKVVVSRILDETPDLLVAVNPTRGLDIKATAFVHARIREAAARGAAVLLVSSDLDELSAVSDRTAYMTRGSLIAGSGPAAVVGGVDS